MQGGIMIPRPSAAGKEWYRFILHLNIRALYIRLHHPLCVHAFLRPRLIG